MKSLWSRRSSQFALAVSAVMLTSCSSIPAPSSELVATSERQWTGIAVSSSARVFVNFPRWSDDVPVSVGELIDGQVRPYPDVARQAWVSGADPRDAFVCVQSVVIDARDRLWILDPANPSFAGVVSGGPKLVEVDIRDKHGRTNVSLRAGRRAR